MTARALFVRCSFLAFSVPALLVVLLPAVHLRGAETLVPARFRPVNDGQGFTWDLNPAGIINDGTNDCFDNGASLVVNGQQFRPGRPQMTQDGAEYVLTGNISGITVTRRVRLDAKASAMRYVEVFSSAQAATVTVVVQTQLGTPAQALLTDGGTAAGNALGAGESALIAYQMPQNQRPSVIFALCDSRSRVKPQIASNQPNYNFSFTYTLSLQPGKPAAIVHTLMQRNFPTPPDAKGIADQLRPVRARDFLKDLPPDVRAVVVNWSASDGGELTGFRSLATEMGFEIEAVDVLAVGGNTRLRGSLAWDTLLIAGRFGKKTLDTENVAAIKGPRANQGIARVFLRDGQALSGTLEARGLRFSLHTGVDVGVDAGSLDRAFLRAIPPEEEAERKRDPNEILIETSDRNRVLVKGGARSPLTLVTAWGAIQLPLDAIEGLQFSTANPPAREVRLRSGSRFLAHLSGDFITVDTELFGTQSIAINDLRSIVAIPARPAEETPASREAQILLAGEQRLLGRIDEPQLRFVSETEEVPVPTDQIRLLRRGPTPKGEEVLAALHAAVGATPIFQAELWDGGLVTGPLRESSVRVRIGETLCHVPVADLLEAHTVAPVLPDRLRDRVVDLVQNLGHESYLEREKAQKELVGIGVIARGILRDAADQSKDAEVRRRANLILKDLGEEN